MDLKILSFNKVLFKKEFNMVKFYILAIVGILFLTTTIHIISRGYAFDNLKRYYIENNMEEKFETSKSDLITRYREDIDSKLTWEGGGSNLLIVIQAPIVLIAILFSEEKRRGTTEVLKSMPYSKAEVFSNKVLVVLVSAVLPLIINGLIMVGAWALSPQLRLFYSPDRIIKWILLFSYYQLPILSFALVFSMLTGTTASYIVLTIIFAMFPMGIATLIHGNLVDLGISPSFIFFEDILIKIMDYTPIGVFTNQGPRAYPFFILGSIGMIILARILFDRNRVERSGETLEFEKTEAFFKMGVAVSTALLAGLIFKWIFNDYIYLHSISQIYTVLAMVLGYIVGGVLGYLIASLSIRVNKSKA